MRMLPLSTAIVISSVLALIAGLSIGYFVLGVKKIDEEKEKQKAEKMRIAAEATGKKIISESEVKAKALAGLMQKEILQFGQQRQKMEEVLKIKEQLLAKKSQRNKSFEYSMDGEKEFVKDLQAKAEELKNSIEKKLIEKAALDKTKAKEAVFSRHEQNWKAESEKHLLRLEEALEENKIKEAKNILTETIYRFAGESSVDRRTGEIIVPHDSFKGKIVGPNGKHIVFFEELFGVDVVFNDAPNTITLSSFNLLNREIAKFALTRLTHEKEINEEKIKQAKALAEKDVDYVLRKDGAEVMKILDIKNAPVDLIKLIGKLNYRTSYGQNILKHSFEVAYISRLLAAELNANQIIVFIAGFFHDIGKAVDKELNQSHDLLTKEILEKYKFPQEIIHAAWTHHDAEPQKTIEAMIVKTADAISASRPGARSISLEQYLEKIKELEAIGNSFEGVKKAFAISAGRELRVLVDPAKLNDENSRVLAEKIADEIEEKQTYPGKIKVTTIRTLKVTDYAKRRA